MKIIIKVTGQRLRPVANFKNIVEGTQSFVKFIFEMDEDWIEVSEGTTVAQFTQDGTSYDVELDENYSCYLPSDIVAGTCTLTLHGTNSPIVATSNYLTLTIVESTYSS